MTETSQVSGSGPDAWPQPVAKILLVDDNAGNLQALRSILEPLGHNLVESHSGEDATGKVRSFDFAVILLDINLPGIDGFETAKRIRAQERSRTTPIIFLTAQDMDRAQIERGYSLGAVDFLIKPVAPFVLSHKIASLVELFKEKEQAKRQANQLRLLIDATSDYAIFMLDPQGTIITWNAGAERLKGYTADEIIGQHFSRFYPKEAIERGWPAHELKVARADGRFEDEGWRVRKDGTTFWANVVITALRDHAGHFRGFSKITRDLTERKRSEENARRLAEEAAARRVAEDNAGLIQQQRERLHVTLDSIGDAVISTDADGQITFLNPVAENLTGWKSENAAGRPLGDVFRIVNEHTRQPVENPALRALRDGTVVGLANHTVLISKDGTERPIADSAAPIRDAGNNVFGSVLVFRDVTQQSRAEQHRNARLAATQILNTASSVQDASESILKTICESFGWDVGFYWSTNEESEALVCRQSWCRPDVAVDEFKQTSCNRQFTKEEGLPGRIWASGRPAWILDIEQDDNFPRLASALRCDLHSAIGCPIVSGDETVGVIEFFTKRIRGADADVLETMTTIAGNFGQFIERNNAQERLRKSEQELAEFFENASVGLHWVGPDGTILRANRAELELLGYPPDEYIGHNIAEFHVDEDIICDILRRLTAREELQGYESRMRCKDGTVLHVSITSNVLWTDDKFIHTRCFTRDITERKDAETALRESEAQFRQLADSMPQIVWTADPGGNVDYMNLRWTEFTGFPNTVGNEGWAAILHPEDSGPAADRWAACLGKGLPFEMEVRLLDRRHHNYRWHLIRTVAVHDKCGKVVRWFGTSTDIQKQKRAEESARYLAEASAALAGVVDFESTLQKVANLAVPHFADWSAVDVANDGSLRRLAVAHRDPAKIEMAHELERQYPSDLQAENGIGGVLRTRKPEMVCEITDEMLAQGAKDERHLQLIRSLGLKSYICVPLIVSGNAFGALTFATAESGRTYTDADLALAVDLANRSAIAVENTQLYDALRESDRRKDEFLATLAHELRNPLAPIRNSLEAGPRRRGRR
jgi:PAS domain S-box-containing protein